MQFDSVVPI